MKPDLNLMMKAAATLWRALPGQLPHLLVALREQLYLVSVVAVVSGEDDRVLVVEHRFRRSPWGLPGGFVARGEQPEDAVRREVREEVGLDLTLAELAFTQALVDTAQIEITFRGRASGTPKPDRMEILSARFCPLDELPEAMHPDERERILRALGRATC